MGGGLEIVGLVCVMKAARLSRLVTTSSCLDESMSCNGMGLGGGFMSDVTSIVCHRVAMGVVRGSRVEELCVRLLR